MSATPNTFRSASAPNVVRLDDDPVTFTDALEILASLGAPVSGYHLATLVKTGALKPVPNGDDGAGGVLLRFGDVFTFGSDRSLAVYERNREIERGSVSVDGRKESVATPQVAEPAPATAAPAKATSAFTGKHPPAHGPKPAHGPIG